MLNNNRVSWLLDELNKPRKLKMLDALTVSGIPMSALEISKVTGVNEIIVSSVCIPDLVKLGLLKYHDTKKTKVQKTRLAVRIIAFFDGIYPDLRDQ